MELHIIRTALGIILGMLGAASFFGTVFMIATGDGNVTEDIGTPVCISVVFMLLAMAIAPWLF